MRSEALDITIEKRAGAIWLTFSGSFNREQIPNIREKFSSLIEDGNRFFVVDLDNLTTVDEAVVKLFLQILNTIKGKNGELKLIFKSETVSKVFFPYQLLFPIYPDISSCESGGLLGSINRTKKLLLRKTGIRISRPVAIFLLLILCGWFFTLACIIHIQNQRIAEQQTELHELTQWKQRNLIEINTLKERLRPLEQLGIIKDTTRKSK